MVICKGCGSSFTNTGWSNHLSQTRNPRCIAARDEEEAIELTMLAGSASIASNFMDQGSNLANPEHSGDTLDSEDINMDLPDLPEFDLDAPPVLFASDHFGIYTSDPYPDNSDCESATS